MLPSKAYAYVYVINALKCKLCTILHFNLCYKFLILCKFFLEHKIYNYFFTKTYRDASKSLQIYFTMSNCQKTRIIFSLYLFLSIALRDSKCVQSKILSNTLGELSYLNSVSPPIIVFGDENIYSFKTLKTPGKLIIPEYTLSKYADSFLSSALQMYFPQAAISILHNSIHHKHHLHTFLSLIRFSSHIS